MPFVRTLRGSTSVSFKRKGGLLDLDFFGGTMENIWGWAIASGGVAYQKLLSSTSATATSASSPLQSEFATNHKFTKIYNCWAGQGNAMGIKANGTLWGWGDNGSGELGLGDTTARTSPVQVGASTNWLKVSGSGNGYTHMLRTDGVLFGTGYNLTWTMLGDGTNTSRSSPVQIGTGFSDIMNGYSHSIACKTDGTLWSWGAGLFGSMLGDGVTYTWSGNFNDGSGSRNYPLQIGSGGFNSVFAHESTAGAAKSDGYLYSWGGSPWGSSSATPTLNSANGTGWSNCFFAEGTAGQTAYAIIKSDGTLWMCGGSNTYGELGQGNTTSSGSAKQVGSNTNWFSATVRNSSVFATTTDRKMFSWGNNPSGTLALGDSTSRSSPTQIGTQKRWGYIAATATNSMTMVLAAN